VAWSFAATEPLPRPSFTLDRADKLIVRRFHAAENKTEIVKLDPLQPATPVYSLEMDGDQRFAVNTLLFEPDGLYVAANLNGRSQLGKFTDAGEWAWTKEYVIHEPAAAPAPGTVRLQNNGTPLPAQQVAILPRPRFGVNADNEITIRYTTPADDPNEPTFGALTFNKQTGTINYHQTHSAPAEVVATFASGERVQVGDNTMFFNQSLGTGMRGLLTVELGDPAASPRASTVDGWPSFAGTAVANYRDIYFRGVRPVESGGSEATLISFNKNIDLNLSVAFSVADPQTFRNVPATWGFGDSRTLYVKLNIAEGVVLTETNNVILNTKTFDPAAPFAHVFQNAPNVTYEIGADRFDSGYPPINFKRTINNQYNLGRANFMTLELRNGFNALGAERADAVPMALNATVLPLNITDISHTITPSGNTASIWDVPDIFGLRLISEILPVLPFPVLIDLVYGTRLTNPLPAIEVLKGPNALGRFTVPAGGTGTYQVQGTADLSTPFKMMRLVHRRAGETIEFPLFGSRPAYFYQTAAANPDEPPASAAATDPVP
jgi:hypothetical protein